MTAPMDDTTGPGQTLFDAEEYLHLALHASSAGDRHACMSYLKEALRQQPRNAKAIYLLAAQHAALGLVERAIHGMETALTIEPQLEAARFQLGLLLLERSRSAEAKAHFAALHASQDGSLRLFSEAMVALGDGHAAVARDKLGQGLSEASRNLALSALMQRIFDQLSKAHEAAINNASPADTQGSRISLGAYQDASS